MKAYKFRTADKFDRVVDIIINRRLYCSDVRSLNDIREADVRVGDDRGREIEVIDFGREVQKALSNYRVCSLSKTFDNHLLWAYYAGGSTGLAIEVDLPLDDVNEVKYDDGFIFLANQLDDDLENTARVILSRKYEYWSHEEEVRIITRDAFYKLSKPIHRIIVGSRMSQPMISALYLICSHYGIKLDRAVVADWGIYTVGVQPIGIESIVKDGENAA